MIISSVELIQVIRKVNARPGFGMKAQIRVTRTVKVRLEVSQLITNDYYLERKGMLSVNG